MTDHKNESISPTFKRVLDAYVAALRGDDTIDKDAADRIDSLLRNGRIPKFDDIDAALFPTAKGDKL